MLNDWLVSIIGGAIATIVGGLILEALRQKLINKKKSIFLLRKISISNDESDGIWNIFGYLFSAWMIIGLLIFGVIVTLIIQSTILETFSLSPSAIFIELVLCIIGIFAAGFATCIIVIVGALPIAWIFMVAALFADNKNQSKRKDI